MLNVIIGLPILLTFGLILYLSFHTYKKLNEIKSELHPTTRQMQYQLNRMLAVQVISFLGFA